MLCYSRCLTIKIPWQQFSDNDDDGGDDLNKDNDDYNDDDDDDDYDDDINTDRDIINFSIYLSNAQHENLNYV